MPNLEELKKARKEARVARDEKVTELEAVVSTAATESREFTPEEWEQKGRLMATIELREDAVNAAEAAYKAARKEAMAVAARNEFGYKVTGTAVTNEHRTYERGNGQSFLYDTAWKGWGNITNQRDGRYEAACQRLAQHAKEMHIDAFQLEEKLSHRSSDNSGVSERDQYFVDQVVEATWTRQEGRPTVTSYRDLSTTTGSGGEFVPPVFNTEDWIKFMRAARAFADCQNVMPLPNDTMAM